MKCEKEGSDSWLWLIMCWQLMCIQALLNLFLFHPFLFSPYFMEVGHVGAYLSLFFHC